MFKRKIKNSENAVIGIVAAFLIVGLIVAVISVLQSVYVPKWMEEKEAEHMVQVADQFAQLKYAIDTHASNKVENTPISTSITLGSKEMPFLLSVRAYGLIQVLPDNFEIKFTSGSTTESFLLGDIKYSSFNAYYVDQTYIFEGGGIILKQSAGSTMLIRPKFSVRNLLDSVEIIYSPIDIQIIGGKGGISGYGTYPVYTEYSDSQYEGPIQDIDTIEIRTNYPTDWYHFIDDQLFNANLIPEYLDPVDNDYIITKTDDSVIVTFTDISVNIDLFIPTIGAQIAPGWIETT